MIDILLPTYNGEKYLSQQLDSIICQTITDWRILIRDDGSTDYTKSVVVRYKKEYPNNIIIIDDSNGNLGATKSFELLIRKVESDYFMLCDQDDIWESNKIEVSLSEMKNMEVKYPDEPILICSDATCVDDNNHVLFPSFFKNQKFVDTTKDVHKCLALNVVQGSTVMMNRKAREFVLPIPSNLYHDWWMAVNIVHYGKISYLHQPLLRYRQHQSNIVGALDVGSKYLMGKLSHVKRQFRIYHLMYKSLSFKPSILKWAYYKLIFNLRRL